jgi:hypothetical protein
MKLQINELLTKLEPVLYGLRRYLALIVLLAFAGLYSFLIIRINNLTQTEPDESLVLEKLERVKRPRIDAAAVEKIKALEDSNIEVQALFKQARQNPFQE